MSLPTAKSGFTDSTDSLDRLIASLTLEESRGDFSANSSVRCPEPSTSVASLPVKVFSRKPVSETIDRKSIKATTATERRPPQKSEDNGKQKQASFVSKAPNSAEIVNIKRVEDKQYIVTSGTKTGVMPEWYEAGHASQGVPGGKVNKITQVVEASASKHPVGRRKRKSVAWVVLGGRQPGVYYSWEDTLAQVSGHRKNNYQGFRSVEEAQRAWDMYNQLNEPNPTLPHNATTSAAGRSRDGANIAWYLRAAERNARWVVVFKGIEPGVYPDWLSCQTHVIGVSRSLYNKFLTRQMAVDAFVDANADGCVETLSR
ncbi:hypothetical protein BJ138DRAFT_1118935 [Hygrophoropsis aurantiaca]|uniref:Uncharacterized protein n=1 Tax=Hygrophoropsis aurantiaca TaxID=72124 RepID=A0ACB7ZV68_9AGAM|nr:hypothetical protein BJ138DRAFT_1118935 [Hygrophoropsis aurantiaca]